ncbi:DUF1499 domain-containing protein [Luteimonas vadosa]
MKPSHVAFALAIVAALLLLVAGPGVRAQLWPHGTGFELMRLGAYLGMGVIGLSVVLLLLPRMRRTHPRLLLASMLLAVVVVAIPWHGLREARRLPPIHDISTDTTQPPAFVAVLPLRAGAPNSAEYGGEEIAAQQRVGYPDLAPLRLDLPAEDAFEHALATARLMGWELVDADPASGRIEATDTTFWFGFKDDVVVRVRPDGDGSRIDVRSVSRVGGSDVGANAARIRAYLRRIGG